MNVTLPPQYEALIREKVETGDYLDASAVVEEALRLLEERDKLARLRAAIAVAEEQVARGEVVAWTPELHAQVREEAIRNVRAGKRPRPDVLP